MAENIEVMLSEEEVDRKISELGARISKDYEGKEVFLYMYIKGASFFCM